VATRAGVECLCEIRRPCGSRHRARRILAHRFLSLARQQFGRFRTEADIGPDFMSTRPKLTVRHRQRTSTLERDYEPNVGPPDLSGE
jgi:hypothetical protein